MYKGLCVLPEFNGNPNMLSRFVHLCDQLVAQFMRAEPGLELSNLALLNGILIKLPDMPHAQLIRMASSKPGRALETL